MRSALWWMLGFPALLYFLVVLIFNIPRDDYVVVVGILEAIGFTIFAIRAGR